METKEIFYININQSVAYFDNLDRLVMFVRNVIIKSDTTTEWEKATCFETLQTFQEKMDAFTGNPDINDEVIFVICNDLFEIVFKHMFVYVG